MSKPVVITADSTVDLSPELVERFQIKVIPLTIVLGDESFLDGVHFTPIDMYKRYHEDGTLPKTSAPGVQEFLDFFTPLVTSATRVILFIPHPPLFVSSLSLWNIRRKKARGIHKVLYDSLWQNSRLVHRQGLRFLL